MSRPVETVWKTPREPLKTVPGTDWDAATRRPETSCKESVFRRTSLVPGTEVLG